MLAPPSEGCAVKLQEGQGQREAKPRWEGGERAAESQGEGDASTTTEPEALTGRYGTS